MIIGDKFLTALTYTLKPVAQPVLVKDMVILNTFSHLTRDDTDIKNILSRMPKEVAESFNEEQLAYIKIAITVASDRRYRGNHSVDARGTFKIPLFPWRYYYVLLFGRNYRELSRKEKRISLITASAMATLFLIFSSLLGLLIIYLFKSAMGIDLIPGYSLGIWDWFQGLWR